MKNLITYAIWSPAGKKVTLLETEANPVAFAAGSSFQVLGVEQATDGSGAATVYLAERRDNSATLSGARERRMLQHLKKKLAVRSAESVGPDAGRDQPRMQVGLGRLIPAPTRSADDADGPEVR